MSLTDLRSNLRKALHFAFGAGVAFATIYLPPAASAAANSNPALAGCLSARQAQLLLQKPLYRILVRGGGDVVTRFHLPAIKKAMAANPDWRYELVIVDDSTYWRGDEKLRPIREAAVKQFKEAGMYVDLYDFKDDPKRAQALLTNLHPDLEVIATPAFAHMDNAEDAIGRADQVLIEKPLDASIDKVRNFLKDHRYPDSVRAIDHYHAYLASLTHAQVDELYAHLGGRIAKMQWYMVENHTKYDPHYKSTIGAEDAIRNEGREKALDNGIISDLAPHLFASFGKLFRINSFRPQWLKAGQYENAPIQGETIAGIGFNVKGARGETVQGEAYFGKGIRGVQALGSELDSDAKGMIIEGVNGARVLFNFGALRAQNPMAKKAVFLDKAGNPVGKTFDLTADPYFALYNSVLRKLDPEDRVELPLNQSYIINYFIDQLMNARTLLGAKLPKVPVVDQNGDVPLLEQVLPQMPSAKLGKKP